MFFTREIRDELFWLLSSSEDLLQHLKHYGGMYSPVRMDNDFRIKKGELWEAYQPLLEKLAAADFSEEMAFVELTESEILCCGWFFKKNLRSAERGKPISIELCKAFYDIDPKIRNRGQSLFLPFDGISENHPLKKLIQKTDDGF